MMISSPRTTSTPQFSSLDREKEQVFAKPSRKSRSLAAKYAVSVGTVGTAGTAGTAEFPPKRKAAKPHPKEQEVFCLSPLVNKKKAHTKFACSL